MLLTALIVIVVLGYVLEEVLGFLNQRSARQPLDPEIADLYDAAERERSLAYGAAKHRLSFVSSTVSTVALLFALGFGWLADLDAWVRGIVTQEISVSLLFIASLSVISWWISLPFSLYNTFAVEARFGFNKTTWKTFVLDTIKSTVLTTLIGGTILTLILWIYQQLGDSFWIVAWLVIAGFSLFMFMFGTSLILPLFNTLTPVPDGELRNRIIAYCTSQGYAIGTLSVMDGSRRSTKANAFFAGLGRTKMIVLFDTLVEKLSTDEIVAVLAHEVGHYKRKHSLSMFVLTSAESFAMLALLGWLLRYPALSGSLGTTRPSFHLAAFAFFLLYSPIGMLQGLVNNSLSRRREFEADAFAKRTDSAEALASGLRKISADALSNLNPHPWYVRFNYTHPPLLERLRALT
jgi:STE24 endopeptidase